MFLKIFNHLDQYIIGFPLKQLQINLTCFPTLIPLQKLFEVLSTLLLYSTRLSSADKIPVVLDLGQSSLIDRFTKILAQFNKHSRRTRFALEHLLLYVVVDL